MPRHVEEYAGVGTKDALFKWVASLPVNANLHIQNNTLSASWKAPNRLEVPVSLIPDPEGSVAQLLGRLGLDGIPSRARVYVEWSGRYLSDALVFEWEDEDNADE
jgi:hypothetical protein